MHAASALHALLRLFRPRNSSSNTSPDCAKGRARLAAAYEMPIPLDVSESPSKPLSLAKQLRASQREWAALLHRYLRRAGRLDALIAGLERATCRAAASANTRLLTLDAEQEQHCEAEKAKEQEQEMAQESQPITLLPPDAYGVVPWSLLALIQAAEPGAAVSALPWTSAGRLGGVGRAGGGAAAVALFVSTNHTRPTAPPPPPVAAALGSRRHHAAPAAPPPPVAPLASPASLEPAALELPGRMKDVTAVLSCRVTSASGALLGRPLALVVGVREAETLLASMRALAGRGGGSPGQGSPVLHLCLWRVSHHQPTAPSDAGSILAVVALPFPGALLPASLRMQCDTAGLPASSLEQPRVPGRRNGIARPRAPLWGVALLLLGGDGGSLCGPGGRASRGAAAVLRDAHRAAAPTPARGAR